MNFMYDDSRLVYSLYYDPSGWELWCDAEHLAYEDGSLYSFPSIDRAIRECFDELRAGGMRLTIPKPDQLVSIS